jgi:hypothetical protein
MRTEGLERISQRRKQAEPSDDGNAEHSSSSFSANSIVRAAPPGPAAPGAVPTVSSGPIGADRIDVSHRRDVVRKLCDGPRPEDAAVLVGGAIPVLLVPGSLPVVGP